MTRSADEIKARCRSILTDPTIVGLVRSSSSPTAAYDLVYQATGSVALAKSARWLAVLRRDHPDEYARQLTPEG